MLASHNSFTFMPPHKSIYKIVSKFWKCQDKSLREQYMAGVRYFDVRVCKKYGLWVPCHGLAEFDIQFNTLHDISKYFKTEYPDSVIRIILERGDDSLFRDESKTLRLFKNVVFICIKDNWEVLYQSKTHPKVVDYCFKGWNIKNVIGNPIRSTAKKVSVTDDMIQEKSVVYFKDFV